MVKIGYGLSMEQTQKLIMTPELRQAITILQLSAVELTEYIEQELLENPLLEVKDEIESGENDSGELDPSKVSEKFEEKFDIDWQEYFSDRSDLGYIRQPREELPEHSFENFVTEAPTLHEHLHFQLNLAVSSDLDRAVGEFLIGSIDDHGYLQTTVEEVAKHFQLPEEDVVRVLKIIQTFDPAGVGARSLAECLLIQLQQLGKLNPANELVIQGHLEDLARGRLAKIAATLGLSIREVQGIADLIKSLDPKPGLKYGSLDDVRYLVPDVVVERVNGEYVVLVNDVNVPRLGINSTYSTLLRKGEGFDVDSRKFLEGKLNSAVWLIRSIEQRRLTLYKVASCIVEIQREFLEKGIKYLKPLNLRQVAEMVGLHESTVSRATANKYIQTPQGVFELKYFFGSGVKDNTGSSKTSAQSIKKMIRELIEAEDPSMPLSDQRIAEILNEKGIQISRRTVAKYRTELGIFTTPKRKRY